CGHPAEQGVHGRRPRLSRGRHLPGGSAALRRGGAWPGRPRGSPPAERDRGPGGAGSRLALSYHPGSDLGGGGDCNPDVLVLGDDVTPSFGQQEKLVEGIWMVVGGSAAITAVAAARLGLRVELVAAVGADPAGDFMLAQLSREGVGTAAVAVRDGAPTGMTGALSRGADRAILTAVGPVASLAARGLPRTLL